MDEARENDGVINEGGKKNRASSIIRYQQNILKNRASETGIEKHRDGITGERREERERGGRRGNNRKKFLNTSNK